MRRENDAYYSQSWIVDALLSRQWIDKDEMIVEPSVGEGAISKRFGKLGYGKITTSDINPSLEADFHYDFFAPKSDVIFQDCDWIVTNPPYQSGVKGAYFMPSDYARLAIQRAKFGVALFLRMTFLEPCYDRIDLLTGRVKGKPKAGMHLERVISCPRISFTGDGGTDPVACGWFVWKDSQQSQKTIMEIYTPKERDKVITGQRSLL